jgi:hypothetical protein
MAARTGGLRGLRLDLWGAALALLALVVFLLHGFGGALSRDLALYAYAGQQAADGVAPYVAVLNRAGPLAHLVPAVGVLAARAVGADELTGMRVLFMVLSIACVWVLYLLGRDVYRSRLAGATSAVALLAFEGFVLYATGGPREKTTMVLLVTLALLATARSRWATAGAMTALATLTWQPALFLGAAAALGGTLAIDRSRWFRDLVRFALGGIAVSVGCIVVFWVWGALDELYEGFVGINSSYTDQPGIIESLRVDPTIITEGFGWTTWLVVVGLGLLALVSLLWLVPAVRRRDLAEPSLMAVAAGGVGSVLWSLRAFNGWGDLMVFLPVAALGFGGLVALTRRVLLPRRPRLADGLVLALIAGGISVSVVMSLTTRVDTLDQQRADVEAVFALVPDDATVVSIGAPQPLVLTGRTDPFRHQMFLTGLTEYVDDTWPGGIEGFADDVEAAQPTFITMDHPTWYSFMDDEIAQHYTLIGTSDQFSWYVRNDVGAEKIAELQAALGYTPAG